MRVAIYARVSTQEQNLETQITACTQYCQQKQWEYEIFEEKISGTKSTRPELDKLLTNARQGQYQAVMVWKLDRLGRSTIHLIQLIEEFRNKNIKFISVTQGINTEDAMGRFFLTVMAGIAELEREYIKERTQKRIDTLKAKGQKLGRPTGSKDKKQRKKGGYWLRYNTTK